MSRARTVIVAGFVLLVLGLVAVATTTQLRTPPSDPQLTASPVSSSTDAPADPTSGVEPDAEVGPDTPAPSPRNLPGPTTSP